MLSGHIIIYMNPNITKQPRITSHVFEYYSLKNFAFLLINLLFNINCSGSLEHIFENTFFDINTNHTINRVLYFILDKKKKRKTIMSSYIR